MRLARINRFDLDCDFTGNALREVISPKIGRPCGGLALGRIQTLKLKAPFIPNQALALPHVEVEPRHHTLLLS